MLEIYWKVTLGYSIFLYTEIRYAY